MKTQTIKVNYTVENLKKILKSLNSQGLFASPKSARQHFWIDMWNEMSEISSLQIHKSHLFSQFSDENTLNVFDGHVIKQSNDDATLKVSHQTMDYFDKSFSSFHLDVPSIFREIDSTGNQEFFNNIDWKINFRDGMLLLVENGISQVLCLLDEVYFPQPEMLEDLISVIYLAKIANIQISKMNRAIEKICGLDYVNTQQDPFTGNKFVNYSEVTSFDECRRVLNYFEKQPVVIMGGDYCMLDSGLKEQLIAHNSVFIHIIKTPRVQDSFMNRFINVHHVNSIAEAVITAYEVTEKQSNVLFFGGIQLDSLNSQKLGDEFIKEVLS